MGVALGAATAGCLGGDEASAAGDVPSSDDRGPLAFEDVRLVADRPAGYRSYDPVPDGTYAVDETVWVYAEPTGVETTDAGGDRVRYALAVEFAVTGPSGETVGTFADVVSPSIPESADLDELYLYAYYVPGPDAVPGEYAGEFAVTDEVSDDRAADVVTFTLEAHRNFPDEFGSRIDRELDVTVTGLAESDGVVRLAYETPSPIESVDAEYEFGFVAGTYARLAGEEWATDRLAVDVVGLEGDAFRWDLDASTARAYVDGELTEETLVDEIRSTLEPA